jgi:hypothetical protein
MKNSNGPIGNQTRDLPVCSAVPQPLHHRVSPYWNKIESEQCILLVLIIQIHYDARSLSYSTMHGPYHTDTLRCTVLIIQIHYDARSLSYRYTMMHSPQSIEIKINLQYKEILIPSPVAAELGTFLLELLQIPRTMLGASVAVGGGNEILLCLRHLRQWTLKNSVNTTSTNFLSRMLNSRLDSNTQIPRCEA